MNKINSIQFNSICSISIHCQWNLPKGWNEIFFSQNYQSLFVSLTWTNFRIVNTHRTKRGGKFTPRPTFCLLHNSWTITDFGKFLRWLVPQFCPANNRITFFLIWRHHLTWWRHLDIAMSRISWRFSVFRIFFQGKHKKLQILEFIYMFSKAGNLTVTSAQS